MSREVKQIFALLGAFSTYYLFSNYVLTISQADGSSMHPTLKDGQLLLVRRLLYKPQVGDIIIATSPIKPSITVCKRITKMQNDFDYKGDMIPTNHVWIEGDNKESSFDSRMHGPIPINLILGKVIQWSI